MIKEISAKHDDEKRRTQINFDEYKRKVSLKCNSLTTVDQLKGGRVIEINCAQSLSNEAVSPLSESEIRQKDLTIDKVT